MSVFYTSDLHIGHAKVAGIRGYSKVTDYDNYVEEPDTEAHDRDLSRVWDSMVKPDDIVYVLGDTGMSNFDKVVLPWFAERPGTKHLIAGNHDPVHPARSDALKLQPKWLKVFATISPYATRKAAGHKFLLSHFPYESWGDGPERGGAEASRWNEWRLPESDVPLLHGHTHGTECDHDQMLHVGWDAWGRPVHESEVLMWLDGR